MTTVNDLKIIVIDDNKAIHQDFIKILSVNEADDLSGVEKKLFGDVGAPKKSVLPYFQIDTASQGQEGAKMVEDAFKAGNPYALAFVDIRMPPGWDGVETVKHIWGIDPEIQVVICTAYSDYSWEETVDQLGQKENLLILKKPFDNIAVRQLAYALTKKWQLLQEKRDYTKMLEERVDERTNSLQELLSVARGTLESSADGILVLNNENQVVNYNNKLLEMCSIPQSLIDARQGDLVMAHIARQAEDSSAFLNMVSDLSEKADRIKIEKFNFTHDHIFECYSQPYKLKDKTVGRVWSFRDITQRIVLEKKLEYQATHDSLTGLPNRVLMLDRLQHALEYAKRHQSLFAILFFDLNRFKLINDSLGHAAGDELLKCVAKRLGFMLRKTDTLSRIGGDEFIVIVSNLKQELDAGTIANHLLDAFKDNFDILGQSLSVSSSIGISVYPRDGTTIGELLRNADAAMYKAKNQGMNQFQFYTAELGKQIAARLELENDLHNALTNNEFILHYQPQYDVISKKISAIEALIRWNHPQKGLLLPIHFIPAAEEIGLSVAIGDWVLKQACEQNKRWQEAGFPPMRIAVNISSKQLIQPDFAQKIKDILELTQLEPRYLELELTENVIINTVETSIKPITELNALGVHITLDDFGTGNSSINYLKKMPLSRLKIDQSFVSNINLNSSDEVIIQSIISLAKKLNLEIIAEGVETKKQLEFLKLCHCEEVQGFYFSSPVDSDELEHLLKSSPQ
ncbi:GGDEF domain-containing response regulator [Legionella taurinensis]|uniref:cyclic-guanylate-specific phosphodiesterase n=1 Tax=Legionella taurinensis TaxID=70611 RepID=A0AB38N6R2_9GAMM|nr:EAL domain-containing protein [Legionella taurinensis]MDX1837274.1 EAL domain-containing protein [Legionella taurinensis]PUT40446.1 diguanylate cyclase [Legionella taurinensis]PUT41597.1 diguanylate cyclase [Legionella taurinensis]PUT44462.1 diguanylate cyclase [Legionella taurinensis]PUT48508.1 diguanylate cyclase [Legionella taurinensis]